MCWSWEYTPIRLCVGVRCRRVPVPHDKSFKYWQSDRLTPSDDNAAKRMTCSNNKSNIKTHYLDIYLDVALTILMVSSHVSRWRTPFGKSPTAVKRLRVRGVDHRWALQCFTMLLPKPLSTKTKTNLQFLSHSCCSSQINTPRYWVSVIFSGLPHHHSWQFLLKTRFLAVLSPPLSLWTQLGAKNKALSASTPS